MSGIRHFDNDRIDHGQIRGHGKPVVEKAWILKMTGLIEQVGFIERPSDALNRSALHLPLDITWMNRSSGILQSRIADHIDLSGLGIHLDIANVNTKSHPDATDIF